ncbi:MAG TPA: Crp/Fnr family transcriptional regulator [Pyrinomonadaceae bacterium]|nr:Crp/Fnr family transcriptional regulator [Pyrinomonadaceae bacterium]
MSAHIHPIKNQLLSALVNTQYQHLVPHLQRVDLALGDVVYRMGREIEHVYFPENSVVSLLSTLENGATTEVGLVGHEGMVGLTVFLGGALTPEQAIVQLAGTALRMKASVLRAELRVGSSLQLLLLRYTRSFLALMSQSVVCSQHHSLDQRFARWLLMMHDYSESNTLNLTHEMVAGMIGTRRAGVTVAALALREKGLVSASRGSITILDRDGLEAAACECYSIIRDEFSRLHASQIINNPAP